ANQYSLRSDGSSSFVNCILKDPSYGGYFSFNNCVILAGGGSLSNSEYKNCILVSTGSGASSSTYYNNLFISDTDLTNMTNTTNVRVSTSDERVANLIGDYSDSKTYELTEAAKAIMTGTDGKEVGIYGGNLPYTATPTNPQITKFEVASKSTADGKLSVDIEVNSAE
ncbi:MAG: hypothetical protein Q4D41_12420, partial [Prevotellaceae bacterium]|nr:hypothetical protein [Prevotellaceae bacterium]